MWKERKKKGVLKRARGKGGEQAQQDARYTSVVSNVDMPETTNEDSAGTRILTMNGFVLRGVNHYVLNCIRAHAPAVSWFRLL